MIDSNSDRLKGSILNDGLSSSTPDKFLLSEKLSPVHSSMSFPDDEHSNFPLYRGKASKILDILTTYINDSTYGRNAGITIDKKLIHRNFISLKLFGISVLC